MIRSIVMITLLVTVVFANAEKKDSLDRFLLDLDRIRIPILPVVSGGKARYYLPKSFDFVLADSKKDTKILTRLKNHCKTRPDHWLLVSLVKYSTKNKLGRQFTRKNRGGDLIWYVMKMNPERDQ